MKHFCSFSEAIREGAKLRPQARCLIFIAGRSCAVGAGLEAMGVGYRELESVRENLAVYGIAEQAFPYLETKSSCPVVVCRRGDTLLNLAWHLNDHHGYTREQVADWLESEEEKLGFVTLVESQVNDEVCVTV